MEIFMIWQHSIRVNCVAWVYGSRPEMALTSRPLASLDRVVGVNNIANHSICKTAAK